MLAEFLALIEQLVNPPGGGSGVTPPFVLSKSGNASVGTYLRVGEAVSSNTGQLIKGVNYLVEISASNGSNVATNTVLQVQRRTGVNTFVDISGASVTIVAGSYKATNTGLVISIGPDEEISAYVKSGSTLDNPILMIYCTPQAA